jgi:hypothetical protein
VVLVEVLVEGGGPSGGWSEIGRVNLIQRMASRLA